MGKGRWSGWVARGAGGDTLVGSAELTEKLEMEMKEHHVVSESASAEQSGGNKVSRPQEKRTSVHSRL